MSIGTLEEVEINYPESDGKPMADNTLQWDWMVRIVNELKDLFAKQEVFVAGDLFWYPVKGNNRIVTAPDGLVVFGRPPGQRPSYKQWEEGGIAPQVVFEVLSPCNTDREMTEKHLFYQTYGVQEYYVIDPYASLVIGYERRNGQLAAIEQMHGHVSQLLGIRYEMLPDELQIYTPDGKLFEDYPERMEQLREEIADSKRIAETERQAAQKAVRDAKRAKQGEEAAKLSEEAARLSEEAANRRAEQYRAKLKSLGIDPDSI